MRSEAPGPVISLMVAVPDARTATDWYRRALGATELWNLGSVVGLEIEGAPFFLAEPANNGWDSPKAIGTTTVRVEVFVDDPDTFVERPYGQARTAVSTRCGTIRRRGENTGRADSSIPSATSGSSATGPP